MDRSEPCGYLKEERPGQREGHTETVLCSEEDHCWYRPGTPKKPLSLEWRVAVRTETWRG